MMARESQLFIYNGSDTDSDLDSGTGHVKRRKIKIEDEFDLSEASSDSDEWDEVPLQQPAEEPHNCTTSAQTSFNITISDPSSSQRQRRKARHLEKQKRTSIHYLGLVTYMMHFKKRNTLFLDKKVTKAVKKLLPQSFMKGPYKKFKNMKVAKFPDPNEADILFIYILKYLIKWFRLNFKFDSNGIRVLGYLPTDNVGKFDSYYPKKAPSITTKVDALKVIHKFKHNRDTAAQVFCTLLRSLGFETRMIFSLPVLPVSSKVKPQPKMDYAKLEANKDFDLLYPYYWSEVINPINTSEVVSLEGVCFHDETKWITRLQRYGTARPIDQYFTPVFYPIANNLNQMWMQYVLALDEQNVMWDVSSRYMPDVAYRWFNRLDLRTDAGRSALLLQTLLRLFNRKHEYSVELLKELDCLRMIALNNFTIPNTLSAMKRNPNVISESSVRYNEVIPTGEVPVGSVVFENKKVPVYSKNEILVGKSETQWKFLGRSIKPSELNSPLKTTSTAFRRSLYNQRMHNLNIANGNPELNVIKLYTFAQTCPFIKPKVIVSGNKAILPRNKFGNIEVFRENMVPDQCSWLKLSKIEHILSQYKQKNLDVPFSIEIDYVPVVIGFSFGSMPKAIIPVKSGVIVLESQLNTVKQIWLYGKLEEENLRKVTLIRAWSDVLGRLRMKARLDMEYGEV